MLRKSERGSITIITLTTILFMLAFLTSTYAIVANRRQAQEQIKKEVKAIYETKVANIEEVYNDAFVNFQKAEEILGIDSYKITYNFGDAAFVGNNYIVTDIPLFNNENVNRNFDISLNVNNFVYVAEEDLHRNVIMSNQKESGDPYPGFAFQYRDGGMYFQANKIALKEVFKLWGKTTGNVNIQRVNNVLMQDYDNSEGNCIDLTGIETFDTPLSIGANLDANGNPRRYTRANVTNIEVKLEYTYLELQETTLPTPTQIGYTAFNGWYTMPNGEGQKITSLSQIRSRHTKLYADWEPIEYSVRFNANGGTGTMTNQTGVKFGESVQLKPNTFTKTNYMFVSWNTKADGTGLNIVDEGMIKNLTIANGGVVDLYAQWYAQCYNVTYSYGDASFNGTNYINSGIYLFSQENFDRNFEISFTISNYSFLSGQDRNRNTFVASQYEGGTPWPGFTLHIDENTTKIQANISTSIKPKVNLGANPEGDYSIKRINNQLYINSEIITNANFNNMTSSVKQTMNNRNIFLVFGANDDLIRYCNADLLDINVTLQYLEIDIPSITPPTPTQTGYTFNGWYTEPNGGGTRITSGTQLPMADITLYAYWTANI